MFDWITSLISRTGYGGIALLMLAENVFPPIPSELIMPLSGFEAASGRLSFAGVIVAGSVGSLAGATFWYWIAVWLGSDGVRSLAARHGRWMTMSPDDVDRATDWFRTRGGKAVLIGRLVPTVRSIISVPAGLSGMPFRRFFVLSALGVTVWSAVLATGGYMLRSAYGTVAHYLNPISAVVLVLLVGWYLYRVATFNQS
ncbi:DedA family protein [Sphingomonas sp. A2-49]|jgi:membrane protein DedA with SNARE-associated domain|uniref:DedA family protein n=1 Tax=Sphingomonas sp. A2-49 TaxID=1391375 RepID=UPI0021CE9481|nr:DedA family protein [Sphingomonas sp. A2-49]MCU6453399.1 DedA family protein [Sphingomonas sp. A2-49]